MSNKKSNWPTAQQPDVTPDELSNDIAAVNYLGDLEPIDTKDIEQVKERIHQFFEYCQTRSIRPSIELLSLSLGVDRTTVYRWSQVDDERGKAIKTAKQKMAALLEGWMLRGKINPAAGIFLAKNHFGYADNFTIEAVRKDEYEDVPTAEEIVKKLPEVDRAALTDDLISKL